jgi:NADPH-ferrihemoprotein reductase
MSFAMTCQPVAAPVRRASIGREAMVEMSMMERRASNGSATGLDDFSLHSKNSTGSRMSFKDKMSRSNSLGSCCSCDSFSTLGTHDGDGTAYLNIYFATQSGTSAYYASQLLREGQGIGFDVAIKSVRSLADAIRDDPASPEDAIRRYLIPHTTKSGKARGRVVFLVSTYHDGGPSDDAKDFVDLLTSLQSKICLTGLRYSVLGFGDSSYIKSCNVQGKLYDRLLNELGGKRLVTAGFADAKKDMEYDVESWKWKVFWPKFADLSAKDCHILSTKESGEGSQEAPKVSMSSSMSKRARTMSVAGPSSNDFYLEVVEPGSIRQCHTGGLGKIHPGSRHLIKGVDCCVKSIKLLWKEPEAPEAQPGSIMHIEFDLTSSDDLTPFKYSTGDNIAVLPVNPAAMVEAVAAHLDYSLETTFMLNPKEADEVSDFEPKVPTPCTVREYLSLYAELGLPPRREVARALSKFATKAEEREELHSLFSKKNYLSYKAKIVKEHIGLGEMITKYYPSIRIPLVSFIELCAPLQPRWYSASSSSVLDANTLSVTFFVVTMPRSIDDSKCYGVCSHYMANLQVGETARIIKMGSSGFIVPPAPRTPLIMVANGTGVAPMRGLCQERHFQKTVLNMDIGPTHLFFGIRNRHSDFLFKEEFEAYQECGSLSQVHLACSREHDEKVHVQHLVKQEEDRIWELLEQGGHLYVCGANAMGADMDVFLRILVAKKLGRAPGTVDAYMETIANAGRYIREGWTSKVEV